MDRRLLLLVAISALIIIAALLLFLIPSPVRDTGSNSVSGTPATSTTPVSYDDLIRVSSPTPGSGVSSPIIVTGQARGSWYSEGQFPIEVLDQNSNIIGQAPATAQGDWESADYVPFTDTIILNTTPTSGTSGTILLKKDNPSGSAANDDSVSIPVVFQ